jgi:hypothetical protein
MFSHLIRIKLVTPLLEIGACNIVTNRLSPQASSLFSTASFTRTFCSSENSEATFFVRNRLSARPFASNRVLTPAPHSIMIFGRSSRIACHKKVMVSASRDHVPSKSWRNNSLNGRIDNDVPLVRRRSGLGNRIWTARENGEGQVKKLPILQRNRSLFIEKT